jgi:hypothetical protein
MKTFWLIFITCASLAGIAQAAEKQVSFSGSWVLDPAHSQLSNTTPEIRKIKITVGNINSNDRNEGNDGFLKELPEARIQNLTLLIAQTDVEVKATRQFIIDGKSQTVVQKFLLDGSQCFNVASNGQSEFVSRTDLKNGKLIHSGSQTMTMNEQRIEISVEEAYSISKDGKKLTIKTSSVTPRGVVRLEQVFFREQKP